MSFLLHPQLEQDSVCLGHFSLSLLLLNKNKTFPWFILVPQQADISEIYQLERNQQSQLIEESSWLSQAIMEIFNGDKLNVAALGNQVPQLHIHHIVRHMNDPAWPKPIWGLQKEIYYESTQIETLTARVNEKLQALTTQYCAQYSER